MSLRDIDEDIGVGVLDTVAELVVARVCGNVCDTSLALSERSVVLVALVLGLQPIDESADATRRDADLQEGPCAATRTSKTSE